MKLSASADCEAMLNKLFDQSIALISTYQLQPERSTPSDCDRWQVNTLSPACAAVYGYSAAELIADQALWRSRLHVADWQANQLELERSLQADGLPLTRDYRVRQADGNWRWLRESLTFRRSIDGWAATGIAIEITDCKQVEQQQANAIAQIEAQLQSLIEETATVTGEDFLPALTQQVVAALVDRTRQLQQSEAKLQEVLNGAITTSICSCRLFADRTWHHDTMSIGCEAVFGYTVAEILADRSLLARRIVPEDLESIVLPALDRLFTEAIVSIEYRFRHADGSIRWIEAVFTSRHDQAANCWRVVDVSTDITDRKRLEADRQQTQLELQAQKDFLQRVIDFVPGCVFVKDRQGVLQVANLATAELYGTTIEDVLGKRITEFTSHLSPAQREQFEAEDCQVMQTQQPVVKQDRILSAQGQDRWYQVTLKPFTDRQGQVQGVIGNSIDITDRKLAELALQQSEQRFRQLAETIQDVFWMSSPSGDEVIYVSPAFERIWGYSCQALYQSPSLWMETIVADDRKAFWMAHEQQACQGYDVQYRIVRSDGEVRWIRDRAFPVRSVTGEIYRMAGIAADITSFKEIESALQHSQQQYQLLVNSVDTIVWQGDLSGGDFGFTFVSQQAERILGYPIDRWHEPDFWALHLHPDDSDRTIAYCTSCIEAHLDHVHEYRMQAADGRWVWIEDKTKLIVENHQIQQVIGLFTDISDRKQTELLLEQQQQTLRAIIDNAPLWIWMCDRDRKVHLVNKMLAEDVGVTKADFLAAKDYADLLGAAAQSCVESDAICWAADAPVRSIETFVLADGREHTLEVIKTQLKDANGTGTHLIGIALDVTDRIAAETALRHSEETLRLVVQNMPVMLDAYDANATLIAWNRECERVTGFSAEEIIHSPHSIELLYPDPAYRAEMLRQWTEHTGDFRDWEWDIVCKDGRRKTILWSNVSQEFPIPGWAGWAIGIDITDRKAAERSLRRSEERYRTLVDNLPGVVYRCVNDCDWTAQYLSDRIWELTGYSASDLMSPGKPDFGSVVHPDDAESLWSQTQAALDRSGHYENQYRIVHASGEIRWVAEYGRGCYAADGTLLWLDGVLFDITDRKIAEQSLRHSEERYRTLVDNLPGAVYRCANDRDWTASYLSDRIFEITGYSASDLMAPSVRTFSSIVHPDDAAVVWNKAQQAVAIDGIHQDEYRIIHANGEVRWILDREQICCAPDGTVLWVDGILFDITDRKRAEEQLRDLSDRLSLALKSGAIGVWEWDIVANTLIWDDRTCELHGIDRSVFSGILQDWSQRVHPDDWPQAKAIVQKALEGEQDYDTEFRVVLPDGSVRFIKASAIVQRNAAGEPERMIGINIDVSVQRQAETKLRQANETLAIANLELARANRLKDEFLANMSHELRTPLSAMLGLSRALQAETFGSLNDRQRQFVETISSSGDHLLALINDILDLAKIESGRFELEFAAVPIQGLCQTSLAFVQPLAEQKNIRLNANLPPSCFAVLDERRICQVLINLLSNAVKFTPAGGQVTLNVEVDPPVSIRFSVIDTGIGIAPADQALLFQPFMQIDSSLSRHHDGTGLGLALVKQIVELHEGRVSVDSELGKGSCFRVTLPYRSLR